jgi:anaerobic selenocysteine-containing dehydrogenase
MHVDGVIAHMRPLMNWSKTDEKVVTVCPYCASGCKINLVVDNGKIVGLRRHRENQPGDPVPERLLWLGFH